MPAPNRLAKLREGQGVTRDQLAKMFGVSERTIYRWEKDETPIPRDNWDRLAAIFGVSVAHVLGLDAGGSGNDGERRAA